LRILLLGTTLILAACSRGGDDNENLGAASGNSLTSAQIDAALGPANQQQTVPVNSTMDENGVAAVNAGTTEERSRNEAGLLRRHPAGNAAE
jgi:ABC-type branched-subunit amino acid transport system substrate-binding protein